jgi:D-3-phosphoglycerate dehydrogenase
MTAGVVGFGRIGRAAARHLRDLGFARTLAHDEFVAIDEPGITAASLADVLAADVISLHAPANADGTPLLGPAEIAVLQPGSILVNTSRGSLIDTAALVEGLAAGRPAIAALDVFNPEPPDVTVFEPVRDRVILTPHVAWYTEESERSLRVKTAEEAKRIVAGEEPRNPVPLPEEAQ